MAALIDYRCANSTNDTDSPLDRVRVRMTRFMHFSRDRPLPAQAGDGGDRREPPGVDQPASGAWPPPALVADVRAIEQAIEESGKLLREGWNVAGDLNRVRRQCSHCEAAGVLPEALGTLQGLLNGCRHHLRAANQALDNIRAALVR